MSASLSETTEDQWRATSCAPPTAATSWNPSGKIAGQATAFAAYDGTLYASVHERGIFRSGDGGTTWTQLYSQP